MGFTLWTTTQILALTCTHSYCVNALTSQRGRRWSILPQQEWAHDARPTAGKPDLGTPVRSIGLQKPEMPALQLVKQAKTGRAEWQTAANQA